MKGFARNQRAENAVLGLVPTMGALHDGHLALVKRGQQDCSSIVASIFVNPTQFGPSEDFARYPRALQADVEKLSNSGVNTLFLPDATEIYPPNYSTYVTVEGFSDRLEGRSRPGHFRGVSTVVLKLLQIVQPQFAYFGRKDAQQASIITRMAKDLNLDTEIVICPIVREPDGLAMSSRNVYLSAENRKAATVLYTGLQAAQKLAETAHLDALNLQHAVRRVLDQEPRALVDYVEVVDAETFQAVANVSRPAYVLVAAKFGQTRLLDNLLVTFREDGSEKVVLTEL